MGTSWLGLAGMKGDERPAGHPPTAGAYGRRRVWGPRWLGPIPDAPAARGGEGRLPGVTKTAGARRLVSSGLRAAGSRH